MAMQWSVVFLLAGIMLGFRCDAQLWTGQISQLSPSQGMLQLPAKSHQMIDPTTLQPKPNYNTDSGLKQTCDVEYNSRVQCGHPDITAAQCQDITCCFDGQKCFYGKAVTVQCTKDGQFVVVAARDATLPMLDLKSIHLLGGNRSQCNPVGITSTFAIYQFKFTECGTIVTEEPDQIVYENRLSSSYEVVIGNFGAITRDSHYDVLFQCRYSGTSVQTIVTEVIPIGNPIPVSSLADLKLELRLASGRCLNKGCNEEEEAYNSYYTEAEYPLTKFLRDPVYVEVRVLGMTDPNVVLMLTHCWATKAPQRDSLPQWDLLVDGCSYKDDHYMTMPIPVGATSSVSYPSHYKRFALKMFTFVDTTSMVSLRENVYIHCSTALCHHQAGSCEQRCNRPDPAHQSGRTKTDCEKQSDSEQRRPPGVFVPQCDEQGQYKPLQCHGSTGYCWCVDSEGRERAGTRKGPGNANLNCNEPESDDPLREMTECERLNALLTVPGVYHLIGAFVPQCDKQGLFKPLQCHGSTGSCWCVDSSGRERLGTRSGPGNPKPNCDEPESDDPRHNTECERQRDRALGHRRIGGFVPQCENGRFKPLQCHGSTGYCWCVNTRGQEIPGSRTPPGRRPPYCNRPRRDLFAQDQMESSGDVVISSQEIIMIDPHVST